LAERKRVYEALYPASKAGQRQAAAMNRSLGHDVSDTGVVHVAGDLPFALDSADKSKLSPRWVQRFVRVAEKIPKRLRNRIRQLQ
jgi:hypothetical protein